MAGKKGSVAVMEYQEMEKNGCHTYGRNSLAEALKSQGTRVLSLYDVGFF
jgi:hypothetical protein